MESGSDDHSSASGGIGSGNGSGSCSSPSSSSATLKKGPWTSAEDSILVAYVQKHGEGNWNNVQKQSGLFRCGKSCRLRWANHLRPNLKKGAFTPEEERLIIELHAKLGNKWARMATQLPGRTDNEIKNYWNTRIKRRQRAGLPVYPPDIQAAINNCTSSNAINHSAAAAGALVHHANNGSSKDFGGFSLLTRGNLNSDKHQTSEFHGLTLQALQQQGMGGCSGANVVNNTRALNIALLASNSGAPSSSECATTEPAWMSGGATSFNLGGVVPHPHLSSMFLQDESEAGYNVVHRGAGTSSGNFFLTGTTTSSSSSEMDHHQQGTGTGGHGGHGEPGSGNGCSTGTNAASFIGNNNNSNSNTSSCSRPLVVAVDHRGLKLELPSSQLSTESSDSVAIATPGSVINSPNRFKDSSGKHDSSLLLDAYNKLKAEQGHEELFSAVQLQQQPMHLFNLQQHQLRSAVKHEETMQHGLAPQQHSTHYAAQVTGGTEEMSALLSEYVRPDHHHHHPGSMVPVGAPEWYQLAAAASAPPQALYMIASDQQQPIHPSLQQSSENKTSSIDAAAVYCQESDLLGIPGQQIHHHQQQQAQLNSFVDNNVSTSWELPSCCSWNNMPGACQIGDFGPAALADCRSVNCHPEQIHDPCAIY